MDYLTVPQAAEKLGVTRRTIMTYIKAGYFPQAFKASPGISSPWRIPVADLEAHIARNQKHAESVQEQPKNQ